MIRSFDDTPGLHLIDLDQDLVGQRRFISCWIWATDELTFVVDPGPPATAERLLAELEALGLERLDFVLLTHIHLDHGGATAQVLERWPAARVICHPRGRPHLADPVRLWEGSLAVLGEKARVYGEPLPVSAAALAEFDELSARGVETIPTPGHAPHHLCFKHEQRLFLGEAAGTYSTLGRGCDTTEPYLRPATPPMFKLEVAQGSVDRLLAVAPDLRMLLFAHHGRWCGDASWLLQAARDQLGRWVEIVRTVVDGNDGGDEEALFGRIMAELAAQDPWYARGAELPEDIRERERDFTRQTLRGILGYI